MLSLRESRDLWSRQELFIMHHMLSWNMVFSADVPPATLLCVNRNYFSIFSKYNILEIEVKLLWTLLHATVMTSTTDASILPSGSVPCIFFPDTSFFSDYKSGALCDHSLQWKAHSIFLLFVTICLLLSFHFSYLINKTVFALIDELLTLCNHITQEPIRCNVRGFV